MRAPLYLGRPVFDPKPFTRLDPVALADDGCWHIPSNWTSIFPSEGRVFSPHLSGFVEGDLFAFGTEPNQRIDAGPDHLLVVETKQVMEVLDFRAFDPEVARRRLVEEGLTNIIPGTEAVVAALPDHLCVVVRMIKHPTRDVWVADMHGLEQLVKYAFDVRLFDGDLIKDHWISVPGITVGPAMGGTNWCPDCDLLEFVMKRLRKTVPQGHGMITRAQISHFVAYLAQAELLPSSSGDLNPLLDRFKSFIQKVQMNLATVAELVDIVCALEPVAERLEAELARRRVELEQQTRKELETHIRAELQPEIDTLSAERKRLVSEVEQGREGILKIQAYSKTMRNALVRDLLEVLEQLGQAPPNAECTVQELTKRLGASLKDQNSVFEALASSAPPWATPTYADSPPSDWTTFSESLKSTAWRHGYAAEDLMLADIAARAGELVVLSDDHYDFVSCYADLVCAGDLVRHVLDPAVVNLDDLWFQPGSERSTAFRRAWSLAQFDQDRFRIVLLDGINRTPMDLWVPTLLDILKDGRRPANLLVFGTFGSSFLDGKRVWLGMEKVVAALCPERSSDLPFQIRACASGKETPRTRFDAAMVPVPSRTEMRDVLDSWEGRFDADAQTRMLAFYRAGRPLSTELETEAWAAALAEVDDPSCDGNAMARLNKGRTWLHNLLTNQD